MNNDLISREALTEEMRKSINERYPKWDKPITVADIATLIFDVIDNAPTVEVYTKDDMAGAYNEGYMCGSREAEKARPQGEWLDTEFMKLKECSICHARWGIYSIKEFDFCPNCGAEMKGGAE